jgi:hypothetical protein
MIFVRHEPLITDVKSFIRIVIVQGLRLVPFNSCNSLVSVTINSYNGCTGYGLGGCFGFSMCNIVFSFEWTSDLY